MRCMPTSYDACNLEIGQLARQLVVRVGVSDLLHRHRLVTAEGRAGAVAIVVAGQKVLLVLQWRPAVGAACWELPRGFGDPQDADATATATREVLEETGLTAASARLLGEIHPDTGLLASTVAVVEVLVDPAQEADRLPTDGETTASRWVDPAELASLVRGGGLRDGISLAALQLWASNSGASR